MAYSTASFFTGTVLRKLFAGSFVNIYYFAFALSCYFDYDVAIDDTKKLSKQAKKFDKTKHKGERYLI